MSTDENENVVLNDDQTNFIFKHYPQCAGEMEQTMIWLWSQSYNYECQQYELENAYARPGRNESEEEEEETINDAKWDRGFDLAKQKKKMKEK